MRAVRVYAEASVPLTDGRRMLLRKYWERELNWGFVVTQQINITQLLALHIND